MKKVIFKYLVFLVIFIIVKTLVDVGINYFYNEGKNSVKQEIKTDSQEKVLDGMNYNNGKGWHKNCKVKVIYCDSFKSGLENRINEFINGKDIVDIKAFRDGFLIVYIEPLLSKDIIIEEK